MKFVCTRIVLMAFFILLSKHTCCQQQTRLYTIKVAGFNIGEVTAVTFQKDSLVYYNMKSIVDFWLLFRVRIDYSVESIFYKDQLYSSTVITHSSKGDFESITVWKKDHYDVRVNTYKYKKDTLIYKPIYCNMVKLFFEKPKNSQQIYADNFGILTQVESSGKNDALIVAVLGNNNTYYFNNNSLEKAEMYNPFKNYLITLKSSTEQ